jgi:MazG family protein
VGKQQSLQDLFEIVTQLRSPGGCPWDIAQTFKTLTPYIIEEAYELVDALEGESSDALKEELGDVLLHVVMITVMAGETSLFRFSDIVESVCQKMIRRHPHVFGDVSVDSVSGVMKAWDRIKAEEIQSKPKQKALTMDSIPKHLPALSRAFKMQARAARLGFDWPGAIDTLDKVKEEIQELEDALQSHEFEYAESEAGDLLFSITNTIRKLGIDPEQALRKSTDTFQSRFNHMERAIMHEQKTFESETLASLEARWQSAKRDEQIP